jgi:hypothetical protein
MNTKKEFKVYYLLISEGTTEFTIFAYLTKNKFRELFEKSSTKFSNKVEIITEKQTISQGKLGGAGHINDFKAKYDLIKKSYSGQKLFFLLDKDLDDSLKIEVVIKAGGDVVQFMEFNSEYLLLKFAGKNPKKPSEFNNLAEFRNYSYREFEKQFRKKASDLKDADLDLIFGTVSDEEIKASFNELFSTLS